MLIRFFLLMLITLANTVLHASAIQIDESPLFYPIDEGVLEESLQDDGIDVSEHSPSVFKIWERDFHTQQGAFKFRFIGIFIPAQVSFTWVFNLQVDNKDIPLQTSTMFIDDSNMANEIPLLYFYTERQFQDLQNVLRGTVLAENPIGTSCRDFYYKNFDLDPELNSAHVLSSLVGEKLKNFAVKNAFAYIVNKLKDYYKDDRRIVSDLEKAMHSSIGRSGVTPARAVAASSRYEEVSPAEAKEFQRKYQKEKRTRIQVVNTGSSLTFAPLAAIPPTSQRLPISHPRAPQNSFTSNPTQQ